MGTTIFGKVVTTSLDYAHPRRPLPVRLFNGVARARWRPLYPEHLLDRARRATGLSDLGDEWILEPLRVLIASINEEANLHPLGRLIQARRIEGLLAAHLRTRAALAAHPRIRDEKIERIIVIAGLQRTGTTTLHRLIASDQRIRAMRSWEALSPMPARGDHGTDNAKRIAQAKRAQKMLGYLSPDFFAVHPIEYDAPEEDILLLDHCFMSQSWEALLRVPSYAKWLESQDHERAYRYLEDVLKLMVRGGQETSWVIKSPHHAEYLDVVLKVFPQAHVVLTHRDPLVATPSFLSMVAHGWGLSSDVIDTGEIASHWVAKIERMMRRVLAVREAADQARFIDVSYDDLVQNPIDELVRIYERAGIEFDEGARKSAEATSRANPQHRHGRHRYDLERFGLSRDALDERLGFYRQRPVK
ncbi:MAG: sulfotransferase [Gammaproteobacteria bacterium]|nr:sulfotransferase [Gammaproteobacteria bacterium]